MKIAIISDIHGTPHSDLHYSLENVVPGFAQARAPTYAPPPWTRWQTGSVRPRIRSCCAP